MIYYQHSQFPDIPMPTLPARLRALAVAAAVAAPAFFHGAASAGLLGALTEKAAGAAADRVTQLVGQQLGSRPSAGPAVVPALPAGDFATCPKLFPQGEPLDIKGVDARWRPVALCSNRFAVLYSGATKTPMVAVERLNAAQLADAVDEQRTDEFYADPRLPRGARAELSDYAGTGMDRGHIVPAGDQPDRESMAQSFALSNIVPQDPFNNRKVWSKIESDTRKYVRRAQGNVFVFSGPLFLGPERRVGANRVMVPSHLFKLVYDESSGRAWAHILANTAEARIEAPMDYSSFVRQTGWRLLERVPAHRLAP